MLTWQTKKRLAFSVREPITLCVGFDRDVASFRWWVRLSFYFRNWNFSPSTFYFVDPDIDYRIVEVVFVNIARDIDWYFNAIWC